ncbi:hypothetical protein [Rhodanobacter sp. FW106-PBR-LB-2-11]|uniref:hypothetical protein n=1 Tax=Rhodanobacter sp. FW106-PBR-LB-2-11 TaxID=1524463 RepID=UPI0034E4ECB1
MNDFVEWWIGAGTPEELRDAYRAAYGDDAFPDDQDLPRPLEDRELDTLRYFIGEEGETLTVERSRTFREQLEIEERLGVHEPRMFACQDW